MRSPGDSSPRFDVYCLTGDGELQEGPIWEAVMYAGQKHLDNLCVMVDRNNGQLDIANRMVFPMPELEAVFASFDWEVHSVDATQYDGVYAALEEFRYGPRNGKPTAIICHGTEGPRRALRFPEQAQGHGARRADRAGARAAGGAAAATCRRVRAVPSTHSADLPDGEALQERLLEARAAHASRRRPQLGRASCRCPSVDRAGADRARAERDKRIQYDRALLPRLDRPEAVRRQRHRHRRDEGVRAGSAVVSIDADLATTSGLEAGVAAVDQRRALNVGVAEANMMAHRRGVRRARAPDLGQHVLSVLRLEGDAADRRRPSGAARVHRGARDGWLSEGHGLDLTMLATAANFETRTNGATHMGNDDCTIFDGMAHLKIIDVSCPQQMLSLMQWIMEGNRGLLYVRVMRTPSAVIYGRDYTFEFGRGHMLRESADDAAVIVSSGRGVHEALAAAAGCAAARACSVGVVDMPSIDEELLVALCESGKLARASPSRTTATSCRTC